MGEITKATDESIAAATHLTEKDAGAVATLRLLAKKLDAQDEYFTALVELHDARGLTPPRQDNNTPGTYLKVAESLGLTPRSREPRRPVGRPPASSQPVVEADASILQFRQRVKEVTSEQEPRS